MDLGPVRVMLNDNRGGAQAVDFETEQVGNKLHLRILVITAKGLWGPEEAATDARDRIEARHKAEKFRLIVVTKFDEVLRDVEVVEGNMGAGLEAMGENKWEEVEAWCDKFKKQVWRDHPGGDVPAREAVGPAVQEPGDAGADP